MPASPLTDKDAWTSSSHVRHCSADICTWSDKALSELEIHRHYGKMHIRS